jgi:autotransporter-associated beta strand protein
MRISLKLLLAGAATMAFMAGSALFAAIVPITISNPGFESQVLADGSSSTAVSGWSVFGNAGFFVGAWNPNATYYANGVPEGQNIVDIYQSAAFSGCSQIVQGAEGQFQADVTYELKFKVGRNLTDAYDGYIAQLVVNGTIIAQDDNSRVPSAGSFVAASLKYSYNAALHSGLVGQPIEIRLLTKGLAGGFGDVNFDEVQLTYDASNPLANHGGPYRLSQGNTLSLNGSASLPSPGASITTYQWDLNDGDDGGGAFTANVTGANPAAIPYATLTGTYGMVIGANTIRLRVTDSASKTVTSTATVTIFPLYTYTGPNTSGGDTERWNVTANWNSGIVPSGLVDVLIPAGKTIVPVLSFNTPTYTGNLTIGANSQISLGWTTSSANVNNSLGTPGSTVITMDSGSSINIRIGGTPVVPAIALIGNASVTLGSSTQTGAQASFNHPITGAYRFSLYGNSRQNCVANFNAPNTFNEIYTAGVPYADSGVTIVGNAPGSLGAGNLTLTALSNGGNSGVVVINAENAMADSATLSMAGLTSPKITMNANDTISKLVIDGAQMPAGTYGSPTSSATFKQPWIAGNAILTVTEGQATYWDLNGATAGAGGASPTGTWSSSSWSASTAGTAATTPWVAGGNAVFAAGSDATGPYTVTVADSSAISISNVKPTTVTGNSGTSNMNITESNWALSGGNAVVVLFSGKNVSAFSATYAGQTMTVANYKDANNVYNGIAYIIGDALPATGNIVMSATYGFVNTNNVLRYAYRVLSLANVASAGTAVSRNSGGTLTYSTSTNGSYVFGVASNNNWQTTSTISATGNVNNIYYQGNPGYYNTLMVHGPVAASGSSTDSYSGSITGAITIPFNAKTTTNPLLASTGLKISDLGFEEGSVTISGNKLEMQTTSALTSASGITGTIASRLTGLSTSGIIKKGAGTVVLSNNTNSYTGTTSVRGGTLRLGASNSLPNTAVSLAGDAPGVTATLDLNGYNNTVAGLTFGGSSTTSGSSVTTGAGTLSLNGNVTFNSEGSPLGATVAGNLSLGSSTRTFNIRDTFSAIDDLAVSASISGTGGLSKTGFGTLRLSGNNTFTGATTVNEGLLVLSGSNNSAATGGITVNNNAAVCFDAPGSINGTGQNVTIASGGLACFGAPFGGGNIPAALARINPASTGAIAVDNFGSTAFNFSTNNLNVYLGALSDVTYTGTFSPNGGSYRIGGGTGTITLSSANTLTGSNTLRVGGKVVIANSNSITGATTIDPTGRLQIGAGGTSGSLASTTITNNGILAFNRSDTLTQGTGAFLWTTISGSGVVEKGGSGELVLNVSNSYSGGTNLFAGTLRLGHVNAIGSGPLTIYSGTLDVVSGALTLSSGNDITIGGSFSFGGTNNLNMGGGAVNNFANPVITLGGAGKTLTFGGVMTNTTGGNQTLTVNGSGNTLVLGGYAMSANIYATNIATTITGTGNVDITGSVLDGSDEPNFEVRFGSLTKTGSGTLKLSGNNNYTGNTTVSGGVLHLASGSQTSPIIVNNGGTLGFTLGITIGSTKKLTLNAGHKIRIVGTPTLASYTLMTASSIVGGSPTLETPIPGYILEVAGNSLKLTLVDTTPPVLTSANIVDDKGGGPIPLNTLVTYTLSFNEDINHTTVTAADFNNAGTSLITMGTITETSPGIFTVQVTPTTAGTLILRIPTTADIRDAAIAGNQLVSNPAILDDTTITVTDPNGIWLVSSDIVDDRFGADVSQNAPVTYVLYFNRDINHTTVDPADFNNAGTSSITIGTITEINPGVFTVVVTPVSAGTLILRIPTTADIRDPSNNILDDDPPIMDDTTINVVSPFNLWAGTGPDRGFNQDLNGDGVANGLAWLLGAADPNENALILLPAVDEESGDLILGFTTLKTAARGTASIKVQYSKDMGASDLWASHQAVVPDTSGTDIPSGIVFDILPLEGDSISVLARIPASAAGTGKKLFGRVSATSP